MMRTNGRGLSGPPQDLVNGANGMLGSTAIQDSRWPYWWEVPRTNTQYKQPIQWIAAPAPATVTEVASLIVPPGFCFVLRGILQVFSTGTAGAPVFVDGSGDILWSVDVDNPIGSVALSGYGLPDLTAMKEHRGSLDDGPWELEGYTVFDQYQVLRYKVVTSVNIAPGAPNYIGCGFFGWFDKAV